LIDREKSVVGNPKKSRKWRSNNKCLVLKKSAEENMTYDVNKNVISFTTRPECIGLLILTRH